MTSKKHKQAIAESLSSALEPPKSRRPSPALDGILSQYAPAPAAESATEPTPPTPPTLRTPPTPRTDVTHPISPQRDFTKVPNSLVRDVVPGGYFIGKSKQLYDCLYQKTRGSIVPVRRLAISKPDLMKASGIGSERTLLKNLAQLKDLGLLLVTVTDGRHEGNTYEVLTPEEAGLRAPPTPPTAGTPPHARTEVPPVPPVESGVRGVGSESLESITSGESKTSFKTNTEKDDDEALAPLLKQLRTAVKEITGREPTSIEAERWRELGELLVTELKIAAGRTNVSSVPAFFTEHLRRRLWKKDKRQLDREGESAVGDQKVVGKVDASKCPDCFGTGMWYPEGFERGVARCPHEKLAPEIPKQDE